MPPSARRARSAPKPRAPTPRGGRPASALTGRARGGLVGDGADALRDPAVAHQLLGRPGGRRVAIRGQAVADALNDSVGDAGVGGRDDVDHAALVVEPYAGHGLTRAREGT